MGRFVYFLKKILFVAGTVLSVILMVAAVVICTSIRWMFDTWSNLTMDELVYHLTAPLEGTNGEMIAEYLCRTGYFDHAVGGYPVCRMA